MNLSLETPALLFPAIAILMLGFVNRYVSTAGVIRTFRHDYDSGYVHVDVKRQLAILRRRIELSRWMLTTGVIALMLAAASMFFIFYGQKDLGDITFGGSLVLMIISLIISLRETHLSNKSLLIEVDDIMTKEKEK